MTQRFLSTLSSFSRVSVILAFATLLFGYGAFVLYAAPPASPYGPGDSLDPSCTPGSANCTVFLGWNVDTVGNFVYNNGYNVGIGTPTPTAALNVANGMDVLFGTSKTWTSGEENKFFFDPTNQVIRAGSVDNANWEGANAGTRSIALGFADPLLTVVAPVASGDHSVALGTQTTASALGSTAFGVDTTASGNVATAFGHSTTASGTDSTVFGLETEALGDGSIAMGYQAVALGDNSTAIGYKTLTQAVNETAVGVGGFVYTTGSPIHGLMAQTDPVFNVGNGYSAGGSDAFTILLNGQTGVGFNRFGVSGDGSSLFQVGTSSFTGGAAAHFTTGDPAGIIASFTNNVGTCTLDETGLTCPSDQSLKTDITSLDSALNTVLALRGVTYHWKAENSDEEKTPGLIAQEVEKVIPGVVRTDAKGVKSLNYTQLIPYLVEAIKQLNDKVDALSAGADLGSNVSTLVLHKVTADIFCMGDRCIDSDEFEKLLDDNNIGESQQQEQEDVAEDNSQDSEMSNVQAPESAPHLDTGDGSNSTSDTILTFTGECHNTDTVNIYDEGTMVGSGLCARDVYSITIGVLPDGVHSITSTFMAQGNESDSSSVLSLTVATTVMPEETPEPEPAPEPAPEENL